MTAMNTTRTVFAGLAVAGLLSLPTPATADQAAPADVRAWTKTVCRDDGKTRVRVRVKIAADELIAYSWRVGRSDAQDVDVLLDGPTTTTLFAFTLAPGGKARVEVGQGPYWDAAYLVEAVRARRC